MSLIKKYEDLNTIEEQEIEKVSKLLFKSFTLTKEYRSTSFLGKKEELVYSFAQFLEKLLELKYLTSRKNKLEIIDMIDKLNMQKELIELERNETSLEEIELAGRSLGRKAQSAFGRQ